MSTQTKAVSSPSSQRIPDLWGKITRQPFVQQYLGLLIMLVAITYYMAQQSDVFWTDRNITNLLMNSATVGIIGVFSTLLMISGGLDLSVASTAALTGVVIGNYQESLGLWNAVYLALAVSVGVGFVNGFLVNYVGINSLITTLGMMSVARGIAYVISDALTIPVFDLTGEHMATYDRFASLSENTVNLGVYDAVPLPVVVMLGLFVVGIFVLRFTAYGRAMYAIGGNEEASRLAGLAVKRYRMIAFTLSGFGAGIAGVLLTSRLYAADPKAAPGIELTVITAILLGGVSLAGGKGSLIGTLLGVLILGTLLNGMKLQSISTDYQNIAQGSVLLLAVFVDQVRLGTVNLGFGKLREFIKR